MRESRKFGLCFHFSIKKRMIFVLPKPFFPRCFLGEFCTPVPTYMFGFAEADCVVDGIKPTVSVDSIGLLVLMGWMNTAHCGLEWKGGSAVFSCMPVCV